MPRSFSMFRVGLTLALIFAVSSGFVSAAASDSKSPGDNKLDKLTLSKELVDYLALPEEQISIGKGALLISKEQYPELDIKANTEQIDELSAKLSKALAQAGTVTAKLDALRTVLFRIEQFHLPEKDDPSDFLLGGVLKNKRGNCLGLSVLCLALAERSGLKIFGVPVPSRLSGSGHLLVRYDDGTNRENFDPTRDGEALNDAYYRELFKLRPEDLKDGYILGNATKKDVLCLLLVNLGGARVENNEALTALPLLEAAIAMKPNYAYAHNNLGAARLCMGDAAGALASYTKALSLQPGLVSARLGLANIAIERGNAGAATKEIDAVLTEEPDNVQAKSLKASLDVSLGKFDAALPLLRDVVAASPGDVRSRCNLGKIYLLSGDFGSAEKSYREALGIDPSSADAHSGLGTVYRGLARTVDGDAEYAAALKINPDHAPTLLAQARAALQLRKYDVAESYCETVLRREPYQLDALRLLTDALLEQRKFADAIARLKSALKTHPDNPALIAALADAHIDAREIPEAIALLQPVVDKGPLEEHRPLAQRLAACYGRQSDHRRAFDLSEKLLKEKPDDLVALRIAANASEGLRNAAKAIEYYKQILKLAPDDAKALKALARLGVK
jgi:tetratricopeptide (TPR) repeat protein